MDGDAKAEEKAQLKNPEPEANVTPAESTDTVDTPASEEKQEYVRPLSVTTKSKLKPVRPKPFPSYYEPEYRHIHYGTFYTSYFIWIIAAFIVEIFLLAVYADEDKNNLRAWIGFTWLFGFIVFLLPIAYSFKYLEYVDRGHSLYISLGPLKLCCFMEQNRIRYDNIKRVSLIEAGNFLRARKQIEYCFCTKTKMLAVGGWCDCQCCDTCWRDKRSVNYDYIEIELKTKQNCMYDKIRVTTDDRKGLMQFLETKNVPINPNAVKVACF